LAGAWKGMSALRVCGEHGRRAPVWQRAYFDRWMRSADRTLACAKYILGNPRRRWPEIVEYAWVMVR
jgi:hypothetical protein